jgi:hypothetical protein
MLPVYVSPILSVVHVAPKEVPRFRDAYQRLIDEIRAVDPADVVMGRLLVSQLRRIPAAKPSFETGGGSCASAWVMRRHIAWAGVLLFLIGCGASEDPGGVWPTAATSSTGAGGTGGSGGSAGGGGAGSSNIDGAAGSQGNECADAMPPRGVANCTSLPQQAPIVDVMDVPMDPPMAKGGAIVDGLYWKTASIFYTGPAGHAGSNGTTERTTLKLSCGTFEMVLGTTKETRIAGSFQSTANGTCSFTVTCGPGTQSPISGYDATPTSIVFYSYTPPAFAVTYTLQPSP